MEFGPLLNSLAGVRWPIAQMTFGSSHATLIGLLSQWWIDLDAQHHTVLDGAPSHGYQNAGQADLLLCDAVQPVGVVEVEGTQPLSKVQCLASYFSSPRPELAKLEFGMLLVYAYEPKGVGAHRKYPLAERDDVVQSIRQVTTQHRQTMILIAVDKKYERVPHGIRATSGYYQGAVSRVEAALFQNGEETSRRILFEEEKT